MIGLLVYCRRLATIRAAYPKDTVILHQIPRGPHAPSLSPFVVKLETFLRMVKVPYQVSILIPFATYVICYKITYRKPFCLVLTTCN